MTTYRSVEFVSRWDAGSRAGDADTIVISINNTFDQLQALEEGWKDVLVLRFDAVDTLLGTNLKRMTRAQGDEVVAFVRKYEDSAINVLVHCTAGEQRSAAVARVIARMYDLPFPADYDKHHRWVTKVLEQVLRESLPS